MTEGAAAQAVSGRVRGLSGIAVIIPSLDPDGKLLQTVFSMHGVGFDDIVLVNDGSAAGNVRYFEEAGKLPYCTVLTHPQNRGKGAALRTAFSYLSENRTGLLGAVTVDGDGQHTAEDALRCCLKFLSTADGKTEQSCSGRASGKGSAESAHGVSDDGNAAGSGKASGKGSADSARGASGSAGVHVLHRKRRKRLPLVIGARDFSARGVPGRSALGNRMTAFMMRLIFGLRISDTQTGLRVIPAEYFRTFLRFRGDRYEYETNMLLECKRFGIPIEEVPISTVYIDGNRTSHFHPIRDSLRIYGVMLKFMFSSMAATAIDYVAFNAILNIFDAVNMIASRHALIMAATAAARVLSSLCNFFFNSKIVFSCEKSRLSTVLRYYTVCVPQLIVSGILVSNISQLFGDSNIAVGIIKIFVDIFLFFISFRIQRGWVFAEKDTELALEEGSFSE